MRSGNNRGKTSQRGSVHGIILTRSEGSNFSQLDGGLKSPDRKIDRKMTDLNPNFKRQESLQSLKLEVR